MVFQDLSRLRLRREIGMRVGNEVALHGHLPQYSRSLRVLWSFGLGSASKGNL